ncbi:MAG: hypothetical protein P8Z71_14405 [Candidatus Sulfobium sp.]
METLSADTVYSSDVESPLYRGSGGDRGEITGLGVDPEGAQIPSQVTRLNEAFHLRAAHRLSTVTKTRRRLDLFNPLALKPVPGSRKSCGSQPKATSLLP